MSRTPIQDVVRLRDDQVVEPGAPRPRVLGKFLHLGGQKLYIRGVTYGTFALGEDGRERFERSVVREDFARMVDCGFNAVRTYTTPPDWLLDEALEKGLLVLVGLPWAQHVAFLDDPTLARAIVRSVSENVRACAGHPAVLAFTVGNEIPAPIVRWHGAKRIEAFLGSLASEVKERDPDALVTYVNYPSTEYLELPFLDFVSFNVYLESRTRLQAYVARLHNLAGTRPLLLAEVGLDSRRNGLVQQARSLDWQIRDTMSGGCAGLFVFSWTDEWHRGGREIEDWDFGVTDRSRRPKPAYDVVRRSFAEVPVHQGRDWPVISVVVCSFNGARTIRECMEGVTRLQYPNYEVIVVNDGSTDGTGEIVSGYDVRLISTTNRGLSSARNTGMKAARGEIVAYIDDDAYPDPHWLTYLASAYRSNGFSAVGGPNLLPPGSGLVSSCVDASPGGPTHVLIGDTEAEHVPGCNLSVSRRVLESMGGFDPTFRVAGDDVDLCWRLLDKGHEIGFHPSAIVWHRRRDSIRGYLRQQRGYGVAEALLERKWPEKYDTTGHVSWAGQLYGRGALRIPGVTRGRIYQGVAGGALFQSLYQPAPGLWSSLPFMPEWYLGMAVFGALACASLRWPDWRWAAVPAAVLLLVSMLLAALRAVTVKFPGTADPRAGGPRGRTLVFLLQLAQPAWRLWGRAKGGLLFWRRRGVHGFRFPARRTRMLWSEAWHPATTWLRRVESALKAQDAGLRRGDDFSSWDLEVFDARLGRVRVRMAVEEHGQGRQRVLLGSWPHVSRWTLLAMLAGGAAAVGAMAGGAFTLGMSLLALTFATALRCIQGCGSAEAALSRAHSDLEGKAVPVNLPDVALPADPDESPARS